MKEKNNEASALVYGGLTSQPVLGGIWNVPAFFIGVHNPLAN
jgi:hypothetical protein